MRLANTKIDRRSPVAMYVAVGKEIRFVTQQVKICPKCGMENKSENAACASCFTSLTNVPTTLSDKPEPTSAPAVETPATPAPGQPKSYVTREMPSTAVPGGPIGVPMGRYTSPPRQKSVAGAAIGWLIAILVIGGLAFGGWWFLMKPASPDQVVKQMMDAGKTNNVDKYMAILCKSDIDAMGGEEAARKLLEQSKSVPGADSGKDVEIGPVTYEGENTALVEVTATGQDAQQMKAFLGPDYKPKIVTVREGGKWKISLLQTGQRNLAEIMKATKMKGNGGGMFPPGGMPAGPR